MAIATGNAILAADVNAIAASKEVFNLVYQGTEVPGEQGALINGGGDDAALAVLVPQDFTTLTSLEIIFTPNETGASMHFDFLTRYASYTGGEDWNVHTETANARDVGATVAHQYLAEDISDLVNVAALAAGDLIIVVVTYDATAIDSNSDVIGIRLKYA